MGSLEYAQARLSARYGERPDEIAWRRIEHLRELPALLDAARISAFGDLARRHRSDEHAAPDRMHPARPLAQPGGGGGGVDARRMAARGTLVRGRRRPASGRAPRARRGRSAMDAGRRGLSRALRARGRDLERRRPRGRSRRSARHGRSPSRLGNAWRAEWLRRLPARRGRRRHAARRARARAAPAPCRLPRSVGARRLAVAPRAGGAARAAVPPGDARSRRRVHLSRADGARSRAPARRARPPRRVSRHGASA